MSSDEPTPSHDDLVGRVVGSKYQITRLCGRGGMGSVYEAQNVAIGKRVALKFIDPSHVANLGSVQRFLREAQAASAIENAHIVQIFDVGETDDGHPYLVMELLRGENLGQRLQRTGRLSLRDAVHITTQTLRGLHRAHAAGIVHRDLKPENLLLIETDDDPQFVKIVDFGISKILGRGPGLGPSTLTQEGVVLGTPFYMSPEQAQALPDLDARTDLWSMGAILFECLAGRRPFPGATYEQVIIAICTQPAPDIRALCEEVPAAIARVIETAMTRDRDKRFSSAIGFIDALREAVPDFVATAPSSRDALATTLVSPIAALEGTPDPAANTGAKSSWSSAKVRVVASIDSPSPATSSPRRQVRLAVGFAATLLAIGGVAGWLNRSKNSSSPPSSATLPQPAGMLSARIVTNVPAPILYVDARPCDDAILRGAPGSMHILRIEAPGFLVVERTVVLTETTDVLHIDLVAAAPAASISAAPTASSTPPASAAFTPRTKSSAAPHTPNTTPLGGDLKLKTDIP